MQVKADSTALSQDTAGVGLLMPWRTAGYIGRNPSCVERAVAFAIRANQVMHSMVQAPAKISSFISSPHL